MALAGVYSGRRYAFGESGMDGGRNVIWRPTERQAEFLGASEDEVLYGGAAGGGKSDALIVDALGMAHEAVRASEYRAIILRRTFDELKEIVDRSRVLYPSVVPGARFVDSEWRFPSGARLELGYLDRDEDVMRYQSRQFQWIGWEELAQWPRGYPYEYLMSRLRAPDRMRLPLYVRATCNPDGPGARWIAERFHISAAGHSTTFSEEADGRVWRRRFIAARLDDNPHLANTGYRAQLMRLPDELRRALLDGRWDEPVVGGAIYGEALATARSEGRVCAVPYDKGLRVDTWWDLGMLDATAIWFTQDAGREIHVIDYYEATDEGLPEFARVLEKKGYLYGRHVAPPDIEVRELGTTRSRKETASQLGIQFDVMPRLSLEDGIHAVRMIFPRLWFDEKRCKAGLEALAHYRREYNRRLGEWKSTPVHDWACFDGATEVLTRRGSQRIMDLPKEGEVLTPCGWKRYVGAGVTGNDAPLVAVSFSDGHTVRCTPEHMFWTVDGWTSAASLGPGMLIQSCLTRSRSISMAAYIAAGRVSGISRAAASLCIARLGRWRLGRSLLGATFTTATATGPTIDWPIWSACQPASTLFLRGERATRGHRERSRNRLGWRLLHGMALRLGGCGIADMLCGRRAGPNGDVSGASVRGAAQRLWRWCGRMVRANGSALRYAKPLQVVAVERLAERATVWCLTVPDGAWFSLANGAVVHNSHGADAMRTLGVSHRAATVRVRQRATEFVEVGRGTDERQDWMRA